MEKFNIDKYVNGKIEDLEKTDKSFKAIYELMFRERDMIMFEWTDGSRIKKMTYGECCDEIECLSRSLKNKLVGLRHGTKIGLYAQNSIRWVQIFWAILKCGYEPVLLNTRVEKSQLIEALKPYDVGAIISDGEEFGGLTIKIDDIQLMGAGEKIEDWANKIIVMSSGTSQEFKLCVYDGECFYYQLLDSAEIIKKSKAIKKHYKGYLKQLMFLPLYHIFGLAAMFMWFAFFSRTFVLLKDQSPETILMTIRKHNVTHIFAVPLFWETVYKKFKLALEQEDAKTQAKAKKGLSLVDKLKSARLGKKLFKPIRDKIFGESVSFLISGGSAISTDILKFFNSIGYHLSNGYGMSEIGIASVELSDSFKKLTDGSVGEPFGHYEYKVDENGRLYVKGLSMAREIYVNGKKEELTDGWFNTKDMAREEKGRYFICGRSDDVIIGADGENINPSIIEKQIALEDIEDVCILNLNNKPTLVVSVSRYKALQNLEKIREKAKQELLRLGVSGVIQAVEFTKEPLIQGNDFKINRKKMAKVKFIEKDAVVMKEEQDNEIIAKLKQLFKTALGNSELNIPQDAHFFFDLNGTSLDYFSLLSSVRTEFGVEFQSGDCEKLYTVMDFFKFIQENN